MAAMTADHAIIEQDAEQAEAQSDIIHERIGCMACHDQAKQYQSSHRNSQYPSHTILHSDTLPVPRTPVKDGRIMPTAPLAGRRSEAVLYPLPALSKAALIEINVGKGAIRDIAVAPRMGRPIQGRGASRH
jgi:hypothetical protein